MTLFSRFLLSIFRSAKGKIFGGGNSEIYQTDKNAYKITMKFYFDSYINTSYYKPFFCAVQCCFWLSLMNYYALIKISQNIIFYFKVFELMYLKKHFRYDIIAFN